MDWSFLGSTAKVNPVVSEARLLGYLVDGENVLPPSVLYWKELPAKAYIVPPPGAITGEYAVSVKVLSIEDQLCPRLVVLYRPPWTGAA
jgi:hypothetical protein